LPWWETSRNEWGHIKGLYRDGGPAPGSQLDRAPESNGQPKDQAAPAPTMPFSPESRSRAAVPEAQDNLARGDEESGRSFPGAGWGDRRHDHVDRVQFTPEPVAVDQLIFRYEYASGLAALGIVPVDRSWRWRLHERDGELGFAKPPRR